MEATLSDITHIRLPEVLTEHTVREAGHSVQLRFDLTDVRFATAGGLGKLVRLHRTLRARGGKLTLRNVEEKVYEVFRVTGLTDVLDVRPKQTG
jgi:anti-sigma B factor antagonist